MEKLYKLIDGIKVELTDAEYTDYYALESAHLTKCENDKRMEYKALRAAAYPSFGEQLDLIYHSGIEAWKAEIEAIKAKYPKPVA